MKSTVIIYGSTTGSTEEIAGYIVKGLKSKDVEAEVLNVTDVNDEVFAKYESIIFGSSTWGEGELQDDFDSFYNSMSKELLKGKKVAVFGCGDSDMFPDYFCEAVNIIEEKVKELEASLVIESFKVDGDIAGYYDEAEKWGASVADLI